MKHDQGISDEFLNAFVDDQLDAVEKSRAFDLIERDEGLRARVCELRGLKEMVQHAYPVSEKTSLKRWRLRPPYLQALAACLLLLVGGVSGWFAHMGNDREMVRLLQNVQRNEAGVEPHKIIVHVGSSDPVRLRTALDETESLLDSYRRANRRFQVAIIANGGGVDLLRAGVSPYASRIGMMQKKYPNLDLMVCGQTIGKLREKGLNVQLLPHTGVASSAAEEITRRLHQGWDYIKV